MNCILYNNNYFYSIANVQKKTHKLNKIHFMRYILCNNNFKALFALIEKPLAFQSSTIERILSLVSSVLMTQRSASYSNYAICSWSGGYELLPDAKSFIF